MDPKSGFDSVTGTFHSLRPPVDLPPEKTPISVSAYALSLQRNSPWPDPTALVDADTGQRISNSEFLRLTGNLSAHLQTATKLSKGDVAFVLSPNSVQIPILYFSLLSLGIVVSPANPASTESEISRLIQICKPAIAFVTSSTAQKISKLRHGTVLLDSPEFESMLASSTRRLDPVEVSQSDLAAIMFSSGTTGKVKGVMVTHRNMVAMVGGFYSHQPKRDSPAVVLYTVPYFHVFGFFYCLKSVAVSETVVVMRRFDLRKMLKAVEDHKVTQVAMAPPVVASMIKADAAREYDLRSLEYLACGGASLGREVIAAFTAKFPGILLTQAYGITEASGAVFRLLGSEEIQHWGSAGKLLNFEAKIVDPNTGQALPPCKPGELWIRGPSIMKGYIGDQEATSATLLSDGWMRTGDLVYIDEEGYLFIIDRLKELIKYKGYQVAPAELEQLLQSHPEIVDAAVIPYPDEEAGQIPMAFVVRQPQSDLEAAKIMEFVAKQVAPYKKIRRVAFVNSIPKSATGKILRKDLRAMILAGSSRL